MKNIKFRLAGIVLAVALVQSALISGVSVLPLPALAGGKSCLMTLDVCGNAASAMNAQGMDSASSQPSTPDYYFPTISAYPPDRSPAVASAEPGETDKPPEA
jgi:hypothetical protein